MFDEDTMLIIVHLDNYDEQIRTDLEPLELLKKIKDIEAEMGRDFNTIRNGPRPIDIDILLYDSIEYKDDVLTIPHIAMQEREFVLRPLCEYVSFVIFVAIVHYTFCESVFDRL